MPVDDVQQARLAAADPIPVGCWVRGDISMLDLTPGGDAADFRQVTTIGQAGVDTGFRDLLGDDDLLLVGIMDGLVGAELNVAGSDTQQNREGWSGGLYATWLWQGLHVDAVAKVDGSLVLRRCRLPDRSAR